MGCLPASVTLFGGGNAGGCVERLNNDSLTFNTKLQAASESVKRQHKDLKLVVFDIYNPLLNLVRDPNTAGTSCFTFIQIDRPPENHGPPVAG